MSTSRNATTISAAIKLAVFTVVSVLVTGLLAVIMGNVGFGDRNQYQAIFANATMLEKGDDVRVAGVNVGEVKKVEHYRRTMAKVTFKVDAGVKLTSASLAKIRFLNLVGDRYMALEQGTGADDAKPLADGATIPADNTEPALDLTVLFDGFKPLFAALTPDQVNELSMNLVQVLQGEGGTVKSLLDHTASLTSALADRDQLIGDVITNLSQTLSTVNDRHQQLSTLIVELKDWMTDLAKDRDTIGSSLDNISELTVTVADLLRRGRPLVKEDIAALRALSKLLNKKENREDLAELLDRMPETMTDQTRTGTYGSWYQYYVCGVSARIRLPLIANLPIIKEIQDYITKFQFRSTAPRCRR
ncbi:MCE family protein [Pimelobacter simplex]|uniref:MCE-family protein MceB n=1 Tax=Nocardioides simplex TaxID=2045 RepID=A0A0A1DKZ4_NOCSI|nr:MCE family protein [Pimelobacter simplex]AIY17327.1 MCE-family protein MceB [Pimelobacter simplex]MCG8151434.1 MCE family protein [Pimelobacter simplex]GEB13378.1 ABC transporter substrate-binding protein [Pimelobacter simplex]SFM45612.1 phospholipid/cholesterol/gamma-HCH transport system substrate-binding protein [Pimelobacter simplex]